MQNGWQKYLEDHDEKLLQARYRAIIYNALCKERNEVCKSQKYQFDVIDMMTYLQKNLQLELF